MVKIKHRLEDVKHAFFVPSNTGRALFFVASSTLFVAELLIPVITRVCGLRGGSKRDRERPRSLPTHGWSVHVGIFKLRKHGVSADLFVITLTISVE